MEILLIFKRDITAYIADLEMVKTLSKCFHSLRIFFSDMLGDQDPNPILYGLGHCLAWLLTFILCLGIGLMAMGVFYEKGECMMVSLFMLCVPILFLLGCYLAYQVSK